MTTSAATSRPIVPRLFRTLVKLGAWGRAPIVNFDAGGGRYDFGTDFAKMHNVQNLVFDPYNRDAVHNDAVLAELLRRPADTATISNVLNVIGCTDDRLALLSLVKRNLISGGHVYVTVFEGTPNKRIGGARLTRDGWQEFRPLSTYKTEIATVFHNVEQHHGIIEGVA